MLAHAFMRHALLAGTSIALACGIVGFFVVLRAQVFAGDALSHVAFTGALAAAAAGVDPRAGLFAATVLTAGGLGALGDRARADDVVIGAVFAWILGLGVLFLSLATAGTGDGTQGARVLFGSILGLGAGDAWLALAISLVVVVAVLALARPLLFASIAPQAAEARGLPVRRIGVAFLIAVGVVAGEATQAVGALLLLGLLVAPADAARRLTADPWKAIPLSAALAVGSVWAGLALSYQVDRLPPSTAIVLVAVGVHLGAVLAVRERLGRRSIDAFGKARS
ncbi:MAG: zinc/manganese transport system permease protein [Solirubrobacteraceae bacterium]|jgi:zinc/manganese transport system permease protein|nr:zinc/manganese transport system permease protein [Solirubrobacteraceae bacterium]